MYTTLSFKGFGLVFSFFEICYLHVYHIYLNWRSRTTVVFIPHGHSIFNSFSIIALSCFCQNAINVVSSRLVVYANVLYQDLLFMRTCYTQTCCIYERVIPRLVVYVNVLYQGLLYMWTCYTQTCCICERVIPRPATYGRGHVSCWDS